MARPEELRPLPYFGARMWRGRNGRSHSCLRTLSIFISGGSFWFAMVWTVLCKMSRNSNRKTFVAKSWRWGDTIWCSSQRLQTCDALAFQWQVFPNISDAAVLSVFLVYAIGLVKVVLQQISPDLWLRIEAFERMDELQSAVSLGSWILPIWHGGDVPFCWIWPSSVAWNQGKDFNCSLSWWCGQLNCRSLSEVPRFWDKWKYLSAWRCQDGLVVDCTGFWRCEGVSLPEYFPVFWQCLVICLVIILVVYHLEAFFCQLSFSIIFLVFCSRGSDRWWNIKVSTEQHLWQLDRGHASQTPQVMEGWSSDDAVMQTAVVQLLFCLTTSKNP